MRSYIYVHQQALGRNKKSGSSDPVEPPLRVTQNRQPRRAYRITVKGKGPSEVLYSLENPLGNGVRVYIQTDGEIEVADSYAVPLPPSSETLIRVERINNRKREPDLRPIIVIRDGATCPTHHAVIHGDFQVIYRHDNKSSRILIETRGLVECRGQKTDTVERSCRTNS
jgi:hypothetical protein